MGETEQLQNKQDKGSESILCAGRVLYEDTHPGHLDEPDIGTHRFTIFRDGEVEPRANFLVYPSYTDEERRVLIPHVKGHRRDFVAAGIIVKYKDRKDQWGCGVHSWCSEKVLAFHQPFTIPQKKLLEEYSLSVLREAHRTFHAWS